MLIVKITTNHENLNSSHQNTNFFSTFLLNNILVKVRFVIYILVNVITNSSVMINKILLLLFIFIDKISYQLKMRIKYFSYQFICEADYE